MVKTIGIVLVAAFATRLAGVLVAAMTETWRRTRSSASMTGRACDELFPVRVEKRVAV